MTSRGSANAFLHMAGYRALSRRTTCQQGFLKEQVEKGASMTTLANIAWHAGTFLELENHMAREHLGDGGHGHGSGVSEAAGDAWRPRQGALR